MLFNAFVLHMMRLGQKNYFFVSLIFLQFVFTIELKCKKKIILPILLFTKPLTFNLVALWKNKQN